MTVYIEDHEAANYLGVKLSYLRRQISSGNGPTHLRPSARVTLFTQEDLDEWKNSWTLVKAKHAQ